MGWKTWGYCIVQVELEGCVCNVLRRQQDREGRNIQGKWYVMFKERPKERMSEAYACESEERKITGLRLVLQSHVDK